MLEKQALTVPETPEALGLVQGEIDGFVQRFMPEAMIQEFWTNYLTELATQCVNRFSLTLAVGKKKFV